MNKNIEHYVFRKRKFLEEEYCENSINELNKVVWEKHKWYNPKSHEMYKESEDYEPEFISLELPYNFIDDGDRITKINNFIVQELYSAIEEYIFHYLNIDWYTGWEGYTALTFYRYYPGQIMKNDIVHIQSMFDGTRKGIPTLTIIGILNDDYEGGELIMFEDKKIDIKQGDLLIFPSNFLYPHKIAPVIKGVRYSYVAFVWG